MYVEKVSGFDPSVSTEVKIYLSVGIGPEVDTAPMEMVATVLSIPYKLSEPGKDGLRWLSIHGQIAENDLQQIIAYISTNVYQTA